MINEQSEPGCSGNKKGESTLHITSELEASPTDAGVTSYFSLLQIWILITRYKDDSTFPITPALEHHHQMQGECHISELQPHCQIQEWFYTSQYSRTRTSLPDTSIIPHFSLLQTRSLTIRCSLVSDPKYHYKLDSQDGIIPVLKNYL